MQKLYISSWLSNSHGCSAITQNIDSELELDFSNVEEIRLRDIERLLDLQKMAVFNEIKIKVGHMKPSISKIFEQTGLYKLMNTLGATCPVAPLKINKRLGLVAD